MDTQSRHYLFALENEKQNNKITAEKTDISCKIEKYCGLSLSFKPVRRPDPIIKGRYGSP